VTPPPVRTLVRWSLLALAILAVATLLAALGTHAWGAHRLRVARAELARHSSPPARPASSTPLPDHLNGARWLVAGGQAVICTDEDYKVYGVLADRPAATWTDEEMERARRILDEQQPALDLLLHSGALTRFDLGIDGGAANHSEIDFLSVIRGLRLLALQARVAWFDSRTATYLEALAAISRSADGLLRSPVVMATTVGSAAARWTVWAASEMVSDPCVPAEEIERLHTLLPGEDPVTCSDATLVRAVADLADKGLAYREGRHEPNVSWSLPFWVANRFLVEDLVVAEVLDRWNRQIAMGRLPGAQWPPEPASVIWDDAGWPHRLALNGTIVLNLFNERARAQAAATELRQLRTALELRASSPDGLHAGACADIDPGPPLPLTGGALACSFDRSRGVIVIDVPGGAETLIGHTTLANRAEHLLPMELAVGPRNELCR